MGRLCSLTQGSSVMRRYIGTEVVSDENSVGLNEREKARATFKEDGRVSSFADSWCQPVS